jgi:hypothetical protein
MSGWNATIVDSEGMAPDSAKKARTEEEPKPMELTPIQSPTDRVRVLLKQLMDSREDKARCQLLLKTIRTLISMGSEIASARNDQTLIEEYRTLKDITDKMEAVIFK